MHPAVVKELIPEFFGEKTDFLVNKMNLNLGVRQNSKKVNDVKLPKWAKTPEEFLKIHRMALESDYVSENLHHWIDLIFGFKQQGQPAEEAFNVFHYLTYEGKIDIDKIVDPIEKRALKIQINEYGQTPKQLFKLPHPPRNQLPSISKEEEKEEGLACPDLGRRKSSCRFTVSEMSKMFWTKAYQNDFSFEVKELKPHKSTISKLTQISGNQLISIGHDGFLKVISTDEISTKKSFKVSDLALSTMEVISNEIIAVMLLLPLLSFLSFPKQIGSWDNCLYIFNLNYGSSIAKIAAHEDAISSMVYMRSKDQLVTASWDCTVRFWQLTEGRATDDLFYERMIEHDNLISALTVSEPKNILLFGDSEGQIQCFDIEFGSLKWTFKKYLQRVVQIKNHEDNFLVSLEHAIVLLDKVGREIIKIYCPEEHGPLVDFQFMNNSVAAGRPFGFGFELSDGGLRDEQRLRRGV